MEKFKLYRIGGCVRDKILGIKSKDIDYAFVFEDIDKKITPNEYFLKMEQCLIEMGVEIHVTKPDCFTIRGRFNGEDVDYVMSRKETYPNINSRIPLVEMGNLYDDQMRRDFTMNAIAEDEDGNLIDPFNGVDAINRRRIECPVSPSVSFNDDPLRMLRALRFSVTKDFALDVSIYEVIIKDIQMWEHFSRVVSEERIREELFKMFKHDSVQTMRLLIDLDDNSSVDIFGKILGDTMWLKPTTEKRKS